MAQALAAKLSRERLTSALERASKALKKKLGGLFEPQKIPSIVDELLRLQEEEDIELKTVDVPSLRQDLVGLPRADAEKEAILELSLRVLELFQRSDRARKGTCPE